MLQGSAAPFAAHLKGARSETPGMEMAVRVPRRLRDDWIDFRRESSSAVRLEAGLGFGTNIHPGLHHGAILNRVAKSAALLSEVKTSLQSPAACCLSTMPIRVTQLYQRSWNRRVDAACCVLPSVFYNALRASSPPHIPVFFVRSRGKPAGECKEAGPRPAGQSEYSERLYSWN